MEQLVLILVGASLQDRAIKYQDTTDLKKQQFSKNIIFKKDNKFKKIYQKNMYEKICIFLEFVVGIVIYIYFFKLAN